MFTHVLTLFDFNAYEAMIFHLWRHESNRFFFFTNILDAFTSSLLVLYSKYSGEC